MSFRARSTYDFYCDGGDGQGGVCGTVAKDVDDLLPAGWSVIPDHFGPGADGHLCPDKP